jgi:hypothetical protein
MKLDELSRLVAQPDGVSESRRTGLLDRGIADASSRGSATMARGRGDRRVGVAIR